MFTSDINKKLERLFETNYNANIRPLLDKGAAVNLKMGRDRATLLHIANSAEVTKDLLLRGANVNARNMYGDTPLHYIITRRKAEGLEIMRELLKHGADVDATNCKGNTTLNHAVKQQSHKVDEIKVLLEYGADINIRNRERRLYEHHATSLDNAVGRLEYGELLIKYTLLKNFDRDYRKIVDLTPYTTFRNYNELSRYLDACVSEITRMQTDKVNNNLSLYEFVIKSTIVKELHTVNKFKHQLLTNYPIYHDIISDKVKLCLERANLLNKFNELQIYVESDKSDQNVKEKKVILNFDCTYNIANYLSNDDLKNLGTAFSKHADQSSDYSEIRVELLSPQPDTKLDEESASSCAKRAKFE